MVYKSYFFAKISFFHYLHISHHYDLPLPTHHIPPYSPYYIEGQKKREWCIGG